jgi:hypothetical protein
MSLESLREDAHAEALKQPEEAEAGAVNKILDKNTHLMANVKQKISKARKPNLRVVQHYLCDMCDAEILRPQDGFIIVGNIYLADPNCRGGVIGDNFPAKEPFVVEDVQKVVLCKQCLMSALNGEKDHKKKEDNEGHWGLAYPDAGHELWPSRGEPDYENYQERDEEGEVLPF